MFSKIDQHSINICLGCRYFFQSGNSEHPGDRFLDTNVEILLLSEPSPFVKEHYPMTEDGYIVIGKNY